MKHVHVKRVVGRSEEWKSEIPKMQKQKSLTHVPHVVVMMNELPKKNPNDLGLSDDRCTHLTIDDDGEDGKWSCGFINPDIPNACDVIRKSVQSTLPNQLQDSINRACESLNHCHEAPIHERKRTLRNAICNAVDSWMDSSEAMETNADRFVNNINSRATERAMQKCVSSEPIEQCTLPNTSQNRGQAS